MSPQLVFQEVATPLTNMHYLGSQRGAMYSAEHNLDRFGAEAVARNRCNTPVKNLYISGRGPPALWGLGADERHLQDTARHDVEGMPGRHLGLVLLHHYDENDRNRFLG